MQHSELLRDTVSALLAEDTARRMLHQHREGDPLPDGGSIAEVVELCRSVFFPGYYGQADLSSDTLPYHLGVALARLRTLLATEVTAGLCFAEGAAPLDVLRQKADDITGCFIASLPRLRDLLATDVEAAYNGDPAATSYGEIIACYPCIRALSCYRVAHELHTLGVPLIPRIITEMAHSETGIDIHPAASIGHHFTIDHGTGVVIGATCIIGNNVKLYQGVTLGAKSFPLDDEGNPIKGIPRHPILQDDVVVYSNATILGRITIGRGAQIGGNLWITHDVPAGEIKTMHNA